MKTMYVINEERCETTSTRPLDVSDKDAFIEAYFDEQGFSNPTELSRFNDLESAEAEFNVLVERWGGGFYQSQNGKKYITYFAVLTLEAEHLDEDGEIDYVDLLKQDIIYD